MNGRGYECETKKRKSLREPLCSHLMNGADLLFCGRSPLFFAKLFFPNGSRTYSPNDSSTFGYHPSDREIHPKSVFCPFCSRGKSPFLLPDFRPPPTAEDGVRDRETVVLNRGRGVWRQGASEKNSRRAVAPTGNRVVVAGMPGQPWNGFLPPQGGPIFLARVDRLQGGLFGLGKNGLPAIAAGAICPTPAAPPPAPAPAG